jgi:hypothetical protein
MDKTTGGNVIDGKEFDCCERASSMGPTARSPPKNFGKRESMSTS